MRMNLMVAVFLVSGLSAVAGCGGGGGNDTGGQDVVVQDTQVVDVAADSAGADSGRDTVGTPDAADVPVGIDATDSVMFDVADDVAGDAAGDLGGDAVVQDSGGDVATDDVAADLGPDDAGDAAQPDVTDAVAGDATDVQDAAGCGPSEFDCGDGNCIPLAWTCDSYEDCANGYDEIGCGGCGDKFDCGDGKCVEQSWVCDGYFDCDSGVDEEGCSCEADCFARECGPDPVCGVSCGTCGGAMACGPNGLCAPAGMVKIPASNFWMGCNEGADAECAASEKPYHQVTLGAYYIDRTEVTVDQYTACVYSGACTALFTNASCNAGLADHGNYPANCGTWVQAAAYCAWAGKQLPTEAQWERAARSGDGRVFPWGNATATCDYAVMNDDSVGCGIFVTWPVCSKSPAGDSPHGLCDMAGNVAEWVADWYSETYYGVSPGISPTGPDSGTFRSMRGGGYMSGSVGVRTSARNFYQPNSINWDYGFRCVMPAE